MFCVLEFGAFNLTRLDLLCWASCEVAKYSCGAHKDEILRGAACDLKCFVFQAGGRKITVKYSRSYKTSYLASIDCLRNGSLLLAPLVTATVLNAAGLLLCGAR